MPMYNQGGPAAYQQNQQGRQDDQFRQILQMMMMGMQQKQQQGQYADKMKQQQIENTRADETLALDERNIASLEASRNRPQSPTEGEVKRQAIMNNPNFTPEQRERLLSGLDMYDPLELEEEKLKLKSQYGTEGDKNYRDRYAHYKKFFPDADAALLAGGNLPISMIEDREAAKQTRIDKQLAEVERSVAAGETTREEGNRRRAEISGRGTQYYESESDRVKSRISSVTETGKLYQAAFSAYKASKEPEKLAKEYRQNMGVYVEFPKEYTQAKINIDKNIATPNEIAMYETLEYLYSYIDREGDLDDLPFGLVDGMHSPTVLKFRRLYQKKYNPKTYK